MTNTATTTQVTDNGKQITFELEITLAGETRTVGFVAHRHAHPDGSTYCTSAWSDPIGAARIGRGVKAWRVALVAWEKDGVWTFKGQCTNANNRQAYLVGWADQFEGQSGGSKHNGYAGIR